MFRKPRPETDGQEHALQQRSSSSPRPSAPSPLSSFQRASTCLADPILRILRAVGNPGRLGVPTVQDPRPGSATPSGSVRRLLGSLFLLSAVLALGSVQAPFVLQNTVLFFEFDAEDQWRPMWVAVSGTWQTVADPTAPSPPYVLTQTARYLDFPKIYLDQGEFYDFQAEVALKVLPQAEEIRPRPGRSVFEIGPEEVPEVAYPADYAAGLLLRYRGPFSFVAAVLDARTQAVYLFRMSTAGVKVLGRQAVPVQLNRWYRLRAVCYLDQVHLYVDGQPVFVRQERSLTGGRAGLLTVGATRAYLDDFRISTEQVREASPEKPASGRR